MAAAYEWNSTRSAWVEITDTGDTKTKPRRVTAAERRQKVIDQMLASAIKSAATLPARDPRGRFVKAAKTPQPRDARGRFIKREPVPA